RLRGARAEGVSEHADFAGRGTRLFHPRAQERARGDEAREEDGRGAGEAAEELSGREAEARSARRREEGAARAAREAARRLRREAVAGEGRGDDRRGHRGRHRGEGRRRRGAEEQLRDARAGEVRGGGVRDAVVVRGCGGREGGIAPVAE